MKTSEPKSEWQSIRAKIKKGNYLELINYCEISNITVSSYIRSLIEKNNPAISSIKKSGTNNFRFDFIEGESLILHLDMRGIAASTGSACSAKSSKPSHVLTAIGLEHEKYPASIRFTLSRYTSDEEIEYTIKSVKEIVTKLRKDANVKSPC